ncbi:ESCRT-II complex subunit-domain-containing protein [Rhodocollybia butyracea]|uniref:ESCRT-II complex subunit-domain-containing protein n=1 Tax=Rhodocollybia butyracea TaxID=206335 RepID=A0A9P5Q312_9AGAR|nr:ESCRT-II complex subunit-domain-containing protein [Rhodocollybia butyracea]
MLLYYFNCSRIKIEYPETINLTHSMALSTHTTTTGFLLPSIHSAPPFFTQQLHPTSLSIATEQWIQIILKYAKHRKLFTIRVEDSESPGNEWDEVLRNERINRRLLPSYLSYILAQMVSQKLAAYEPPQQDRSVLIYWRLPEEWAETLHEWVTSTGNLNTIMTFYEITDPPVESSLSGLPIPLLRQAIVILSKTNRAQVLTISEGEGVRFFPPTGKP